MMRATIVACLLLSALPAPIGSQSANAPQPAGTASIAGVVVANDEGITTPGVGFIRRAVVTVLSTDRSYGTAAVTDDAGRFMLSGLPAGRYSVSVEKRGFVRLRYGATGPGRPGTPLAISEGQRLANLTLKLTRGAVITGTIFTPAGEPVAGVAIEARPAVRTDGRTKVRDAAGYAVTDDRGVYRVFGLPAGDYVVHARTGQEIGPHGSGELRPTSAVDVQWARRQIQAGATAGAGAAGLADAPVSSSLRYVPVYYPGTVTPAEARLITLPPAAERAGIDFSLRAVPASRVSVVVLGPDGTKPEAPVMLFAAPVGSADALDFMDVREGFGTAFTFTGLTPGRYAITAQQAAPGSVFEHIGGAPAPAQPPRESASGLWAITEVVVAGTDQSGVVLQLQPGLTIKGRVTYEQTTLKPPADLSRVEVRLNSAHTAGVVIAPSPAPLAADGSFELRGVMPGRYRVSVSFTTVTNDVAGWIVKSAMIRGQDGADLPFDVRAGEDPGPMAVTVSDRTAEIAGTLQNAAGAAAPDYYVVIFPADRRLWIEEGRRLRAVRPANDGTFLARNLPAGDYLVAALTDMVPGEWQDPAFLEQLVPQAIPLTLAEGEKKRQDLRIARSPVRP